MSSNLDDLMHSLSLNRAYEKYTKEHKESTNQLLQNLQNQLKDSYLTGYNDGQQNGIEEGEMETKLKMLAKLVVHTDLDDQIILKVLEKEDNENFIDALKQLRKKQQEQK